MHNIELPYYTYKKSPEIVNNYDYMNSITAYKDDIEDPFKINTEIILI